MHAFSVGSHALSGLRSRVVCSSAYSDITKTMKKVCLVKTIFLRNKVKVRFYGMLLTLNMINSYNFAIGHYRVLPSCLKPLFQSEAKREASDMEMIFYSPCKLNSFSQQRLCTLPRFESENSRNSEMAC